MMYYPAFLIRACMSAEEGAAYLQQLMQVVPGFLFGWLGSYCYYICSVLKVSEFYHSPYLKKGIILLLRPSKKIPSFVSKILIYLCRYDTDCRVKLIGKTVPEVKI